MTPAVRRLLREHGLTAAMIVGTGGGGRITREDVTDFVESQRTGQPVGRQDAAAAAAAPAAAAAAAPRPPPPRRAPRRRAGSGREPAARPRPATAGEPVDRLPGGRGRGPRPDDPDAQGHRGADDPGAPGARTPTSRWRSTSRTSSSSASARRRATRRARACSLSFVPVRRQGLGRGAQAQPDVQRPLDRAGPARQAPDQHRDRGGGRRRPDRPGHPRRRQPVDPRPQQGDRRGLGPGAGRQVPASTTSAAGRSPSTTPAGSARTWSCRSSTCPRSGS